MDEEVPSYSYKFTLGYDNEKSLLLGRYEDRNGD